MVIALLIVEDEEDIRLMLEDRLTSLGYYVIVAQNGVEGLAMLERMAFDGILLDMQMPVMDGLTMLEHVKDEYPKLPVIAMGADFSKDKMIRAIELGANDYLFKPIDVDLLSKKCSLIFSGNVS